MSNSSLQALLKEWHDADEAAFTLACCLGLMQASEFTQAKHVFYDNSNPLGKTLFAAVQGLIEAGVLERNEDWRIRWNPLFHGSWHR